MLTRVTEILQRRQAERAPAIEKELAQLAAEQQRCRQEGKRVLQVIGGGEARSDMTTKRITELDERDHQLEQRMAELRDELAAAQREIVPAAEIQRAVTLFDPVWDLLLVPERFRILHLLLESVGYDGSTGELELSFKLPGAARGRRTA
jgi:site-specific DNA recombinase